MFPRQTHCSNGHEFNTENTYISPKSQKRSCRICASARVKRLYEADLVGNREKNKQHMQEWRVANRERDRKNWTELRRKKKEWLDQQKVSCTSCNESDPTCLDFHHVDASKKDANLSEAIARWSIRRMQQELVKCIVLCANCHRKLHASERDKEQE